MNVSPNHPTMRPVQSTMPRADRPHNPSGWCPRCQADCLLLDWTERNADIWDNLEYEDADDE